MNVILGYILSGLGIISIALSSDKTRVIVPIDFIKNMPSKSFIVVGIVLVAIGIVIMFMSNKTTSGSSVKQASEEVPIYEGEGKHRKIVGYKKESK
jgi:uncharacterized membrane protein